jgi:hypothetical protein
MRRLIITPSSMPLVPAPGPLLEFIRQAQLSLVYARSQAVAPYSSARYPEHSEGGMIRVLPPSLRPG